VRLGVLLALRRLQHTDVANFSATPIQILCSKPRAPLTMTAHVRFPDLAALLKNPPSNDPLLRRVLNANFRLGNAENAQLLAELPPAEKGRDLPWMALNFLARGRIRRIATRGCVYRPLPLVVTPLCLPKLWTRYHKPIEKCARMRSAFPRAIRRRAGSFRCGSVTLRGRQRRTGRGSVRVRP